MWHDSASGPITDTVCEGSTPSAGPARPGIEMIVDGALVSLVVEQLDVPAIRCTDDGEDIEPDPDAHVVTHQLVLVRGADRRVLVAAPVERSTAEHSDELAVLGTVGPYAAVRQFVHYADACGAEALETTEVDWFDLRTGIAMEHENEWLSDEEMGAAGVSFNAMIAAERLRSLRARWTADWEREPGIEPAQAFLRDEVDFNSIGTAPRWRGGALTFERLVMASIDDNADLGELRLRGSAPSFVSVEPAPAAVREALVRLGDDARGWSGPVAAPITD